MFAIGFKLPYKAALDQFGLTELALPHNEHTPTCIAQSFALTLKSHDVGVQLPSPEISMGVGYSCASTAWMLVPKAAVHENYCAVFRQNNVGCPGQISAMESESEARAMQ